MNGKQNGHGLTVIPVVVALLAVVPAAPLTVTFPCHSSPSSSFNRRRQLVLQPASRCQRLNHTDSHPEMCTFLGLVDLRSRLLNIRHLHISKIDLPSSYALTDHTNGCCTGPQTFEPCTV